MGLLDDKVVLVSGAARGQGRAEAVRMAEEGADIIAFDICQDIETIPYSLASRTDLDGTVSLVEKAGGRIFAVQADSRDFDAVNKLVAEGVAELGRLDAVVANAGVASYYRAEQITPAQWQTMIDVNLTGVWNVVRATVPYLISQRGGSIILTSSSAAHIGMANLSHYSAAKAGLVGLMQSLAVELGPHMIRVNTVHPSTVRTGMFINEATFALFKPGAGLSVESPSDVELIADEIKGLHAMPISWVEPLDIANAVLYLASDLGRYVSGTQLRVDAGSAAR